MSGKDYYEILGIRPNAGREEIELAYKGRRSQYHPDRYAQADGETQAWATEKMQQLNEAYQALSNAELRSKFDQATPDAHAERPPVQERATPATGFQDAAAVLLKPEWEWFHEKVYARPNIPRKKLEGAISSYAPGVSPGEVIVLLDDTVFGGAKEGLLVTSDAVYCKQKFERPRRIAFQAIRKVEPGTDCRVLINGEVFFKADIIDHLAVLTFAGRLASVFEPPSGSGNERQNSTKTRKSSGVDALWSLHRGALTAMRSERGGQVFLIDELIDRQMKSIADRFPEIYEAIANSPRRGSGSVEAESAEIALALLLILHYYGFSKLPSEFKEAARGQFARLHEFSEDYKIAFRVGFPVVFGRPIAMGDEDLLMMSAMFFHRDGAGEFELKLPREEALLQLLAHIGISRSVARELMRQSEDQAESWLEALATKIEG